MSALRVWLAAAALAAVSGAAIAGPAHGSLQELPSDQVPRPDVTQTVSLNAIHQGACGARFDYVKREYLCNWGAWTDVGYHYLSVLHSDGLQYEDVIRRMAILFDDKPFRGRTIRVAKLSLDVAGSWGPHDDLNGSGRANLSCAAKVALATTRWWASDPAAMFDVTATYVDGPVELDPGPSSGTSVNIDVTAIARKWAQGAPNDGLILEGANENLNIDAFSVQGSYGKDNDTCLTYYKNPRLLVVSSGPAQIQDRTCPPQEPEAQTPSTPSNSEIAPRPYRH